MSSEQSRQGGDQGDQTGSPPSAGASPPGQHEHLHVPPEADLFLDDHAAPSRPEWGTWRTIDTDLARRLLGEKRWTHLKSHNPPPPAPPIRRIAVDLMAEPPEITLDGKTYPVPAKFALLVHYLIEAGKIGPLVRANGLEDRLSRNALKELSIEFHPRPDRVVDDLIKRIPQFKKWIDRGPRGYRLKPELLE